jgi:hypothetical protein
MCALRHAALHAHVQHTVWQRMFIETIGYGSYLGMSNNLFRQKNQCYRTFIQMFRPAPCTGEAHNYPYCGFLVAVAGFGVAATAFGFAVEGAAVGAGSVITADLIVSSLGKLLSRYAFPCFSICP